MLEGKRKSIRFADAVTVKTDLPGGGMILSSPIPLKEYPATICHYLRHWGATTPDRVYLGERDGRGGWRTVTYGEALNTVERLAQGLLNHGLGPDRPVMILSDNSVDSALLILAAMYVGIPVAPVSQAYSLVSQDHAKLKYIHALIMPGLVYASNGARFEKALSALDLTGVEVAVSAAPVEGKGMLLFSDLGAEPGPSLREASGAVTPDTVAKILFTSGSTGMPKGVVNTQRMLCSNQQAISQNWPYLEERPPVVLDWLPWSHTFGGNHNFNLILRNGGSYYIDDGKPVPGLIEKSVANLKEISPTLYFNVPRGFDMLLPLLEADTAARDGFFKELDMIFYAAAALPQPLWERLEKLSLASRGEMVAMLSAWGSTETAPANTNVHFTIERAGVIGLPLPGTRIKFVPNGGKLEMRVKGPNIMPGYYKNEEQTKAAFDEDGFYRIGDAGKLADPDDPSKGIVFDGRVSEDFKLSTGTWVHVGGLRVSAIEHAAPLLQDAVVCGHNRDHVALMAWPNLDGCRKLVGEPEASPDSLTRNPKVIEAVLAALRLHNKGGKGSSGSIAGFRFLLDPPNLDANEITDKGYVNQRAVLENRAALVEGLYASPAPEGVFTV